MTYTDAIDLLKEMIAIPSVSRSEDGTAKLLYDFLEANGVDVKRVYNNLWAMCRHYDVEKPTLMLNSHHDTVKPSSAYTLDPFSPIVKDKSLYGLGSNDAGASVVCLLTTFINHYDDDNLPFNLLLDLSAEEEVMGKHGMRAMLAEYREKNVKIDMALTGEPTGMQASVGERGLVVLDCTAHGKQGHAARNEGINALYIALDDIQKLRNFSFPKESSILGPIKLTTTMIDCGTQHNVVPDICHFVVDIRTTDAYTNEEVVAILQQELRSTAVPRSTYIHASAIAATHPLVRAAESIGRQTYISPTTSDQALTPFPSLKMGPGHSSRSHSADEYVMLSEIEEGIKIYDQFIQALACQLR